MLAADSVVEQEDEDEDVEAEAEVEMLLLEDELDTAEDVRVVDVALEVVWGGLGRGLAVDDDEAELDSALEELEDVDGERELVEDVSSVTVCVVTIVTGLVAVTVVGDSAGTTEMSVLVTVLVESFAVAVTVISGVAVGDDVTVCTTVVVASSCVVAGLPPSMGTIE